MCETHVSQVTKPDTVEFQMGVHKIRVFSFFFKESCLIKLSGIVSHIINMESVKSHIARY